MPVFPVIETEAVVQENDKTRIDVSKSYAVGGGEIDNIQVTPSRGVDPVELDLESRYLDWQFPFAFAINTENNAIDFQEEGGPLLVAALDDGEYTPEELAQEIQDKLNATGSFVYTVEVSSKNAFTIATNDGEFTLFVDTGDNFETSILPEIGFSEDQEDAKTYTGEKVTTINRKVTVAITAGSMSAESAAYLPIISSSADNLFSTDDKLRQHEPDLLKFVVDGRSTFKDVHRRAQKLILTWLDTQGFLDTFNERITSVHVTDIEEVTEWATFVALRLIFEGISNAKDDVFRAKAEHYKGLEHVYRDRATVKFDLNKDGVADSNSERLDIRSAVVVRR